MLSVKEVCQNVRSSNRIDSIIIVAIMVLVTLVTLSIGVFMLYNTYYQQQEKRLIDSVVSKAKLIDAVARFDVVHSQNDHPDGAAGATLSQVFDAEKQESNAKIQAETYIAKDDGKEIVLLVSRRSGNTDYSQRRVSKDDKFYTGLTNAFAGQRGSNTFEDAHHHKVMTSYAPINELGLGLVETISLDEIQKPFIEAVEISVLVSLIVIFAGSIWIVRIIGPLSNQLTKSKALHQSVVDTASDAIIVINEKGIIQRANNSTSQLFGYEEDALIGKNVTMLMANEHAKHHGSYIDNYKKTGESNVVGVSREVLAKRKDGTLFPINLSLSRTEVDGNVFFTGIVHDYTEVVNSKKALLQAKNEAEHANSVKSEFLSNISHELRTPLNAVIGFSQMLALNATLDDEAKENVQEIKNAGLYLLDLINDILDLSAIEAGNMEFVIERYFFRDIVAEALKLVTPNANNRNVIISSELDTENEESVGDVKRIKQILLNLLTNAIKYNVPGGKVVLRYSRVDSSSFTILVSDTGIGIPKEKQAQLFQAFNRLGASKLAIEGTGIGLVITKQLVEKMGGQIGFESEENRGTTFWVKLPCTLTLT